jgi:hypothetical protein
MAKSFYPNNLAQKRPKEAIFQYADATAGVLRINGKGIRMARTKRLEGRGSIQLSYGPAIRQCSGGSLIIATVSSQASTKTTFARDGRRMLVVSEADFPGVGPVVARYVYDYESADGILSSAFWRLHPPVYHKDPRQIEKAVETSNALLDQINKEIAKAPIPGGDIVDSLNAFPSDQPAPPSLIKPSSSNDIPKHPQWRNSLFNEHKQR